MYPTLPPNIEVLPGTDVAGEWERFKVFEALHHAMRVCNPMTTADVDGLLDVVDAPSGSSWLDLACGHGELLIGAAERAAIEGTGVDLSPWVLVRAHAEAKRRVPSASLRWILGNARDLPASRHDVATCLGASWVWHGFEGTVRALVDRIDPGGVIAVGDLRLRDGANLAEVVATYGRVLTAPEQLDLLSDAGLEAVDRFDPGDEAWRSYQERIDESAAAWQKLHPGEEADRFRQEQVRWRIDHDRDMTFLAWTVWVARRPR